MSALVVGACSLRPFTGSRNRQDGADKIDARVLQTIQQMQTEFPETSELKKQAAGMLIMPLITEGGFGFGVGYGRGALLIDEATVDYYSAANASYGLQIGASQYAHVLFFMTKNALNDFRSSRGWSAGGDIEYAYRRSGESFRANTTEANSPIIGLVFGEAGFKIGATIEGTKYTKIIP
jgi:lipid-binding SYLF domain-containing protein